MTVLGTLPERAEGLELLGPLRGSGYVQGSCTVRRRDGQTVQLTPLLYALLELVDGHRDPASLAVAFSAAVQREASAADVEQLLAKLAGLGLLDGTDPEAAPTSNPLLALRWKLVVSDPAATRRLTRPFAALFSPLVLWPVLAAFVAVCWFVLVDKGLASATRSAFDTPALLLGVFALAVLSAGVHELGHAAACRYGGATPGAMGAGVYLVWPAFYTNVDDAYRLDRRGRLRVDLGGLYFNALVAVLVTGAWWLTGQDALLLGVATQLLQMLHQLAPVIRADGYHILADLTGVPDLFAHLGPTLSRLRPSQWGTPSPLSRRARAIVTSWVLVVVPILLSLTLTAVLLLPRLVTTAWVSGQVRGHQLARAAEAVDPLGVGAALLQLLALVLPLMGSCFIAYRVISRVRTRVLAATEGRPVLRAGAGALAALALLGLLAAWWPQGQYTPIRRTDRGTITSLLGSVTSTTRHAPVPGHRVLALAMVPRGGATAAHPALLLTRTPQGPRAILVTGPHSGSSFPFALPSAPRPGDTQAVAVNTTDGATVYDIAYALVTVTDGAPATSANQAYALASCHSCTTVAVSFQVVLVIGHSSVVAPINEAVAGNRSCVSCETTALAVQLAVTLSSTPSDEVLAQLNAALKQLDGLSAVPADEVLAQVQAVQSQVYAVLAASGLVTSSSSASAAATAAPSVAATSSTSSSPSGAPEAAATASASASPTSSATVPAATPTPEPSTTASP